MKQIFWLLVLLLFACTKDPEATNSIHKSKVPIVKTSSHHILQTGADFTFQIPPGISKSALQDVVDQAFMKAYEASLPEGTKVQEHELISAAILTWNGNKTGCQTGFVVSLHDGEDEGDFPPNRYKFYFLSGTGPQFEVWDPVVFEGSSESADATADVTLDYFANDKCVWVGIHRQVSVPTAGLNNSENTGLYYWSTSEHVLVNALDVHLVLDRMGQEGFSKELSIPESNDSVYDVEVTDGENKWVYNWEGGRFWLGR
jgi:hypothetical protein